MSRQAGPWDELLALGYLRRCWARIIGVIVALMDLVSLSSVMDGMSREGRGGLHT